LIRFPQLTAAALCLVTVLVAAAPSFAQLNLKSETWSSVYSGPANLNDGPGDGYKCSRVLASSPDGNTIYMVGVTTVSSTDADYLMVAYDSRTGAQKWISLYQGPVAFPSADATALVVSPDGSAVYVTGALFGNDGSEASAIVRLDANTGAQIWSVQTRELGYPSDIAISPDGARVYVCGNSRSVAYDTATGQQLWRTPFVSDNGGYTFVQRIAANPDGTRVYVAGAEIAESGDTDDFLLFTYDSATGHLLNLAHHPTDGLPPRGLTVSPDGRRVFTTYADLITGTNTAFTTAYDAAGNQLWTARFEGLCDPGSTACGARPGYSNPVTVSPDGSRLFVTTLLLNTGDEGFGTVAYDAATGQQLWVARRQVGAEDFIKGPVIAVNPDGKEVYVSGSGDGYVSTTVAYDALTGAEHWVGLHEVGFPVAIATVPDGSGVFVAGGQRRVGGTDYDAFTLRYDTQMPAPVSLNGVASRLSHGATGTFALPLPGIGNPGIECRRAGPDGQYAVVFSFTNPLASVDGVRVTEGTATVASGRIDTDAHNYVVNLSGLTNGESITLTLDNVVDGAGKNSAAVSRSLALLLGDTNGDGSVNSADISQVKSQSGVAVTDANFRTDLTVDGNINSADIALVKSMSGTAVSFHSAAAASSSSPFAPPTAVTQPNQTPRNRVLRSTVRLPAAGIRFD
jgi:sugar lactone lactonase YvrE